ncbi:hypothetical protein [Stenotrophomonas geniculata]|uniref:hypothetical protein n=1 Tax=Stenotrophomonas geniculata TaxID=86188 RepID=UPI00289CCA6F|nr:hypothetical protein [Stenotrophomonas geniculata]
MLGHVVDFIKPDFSEPFQLAFFMIIFGAAVATVVGVWRTARPDNWKANWEGAGRGNTGLDVDHGSFNDVCDAVASKPEKYAEIVPGLLLIFGLLGTFVGLGIALDSASSILRNANAQNALDGGMGNLLEMMGGLGTKFRTSTWGILGFLLVKLALAGMGRETQRQQWVIARMKLEMDKARLAGEHLEERRSQRMQDALAEVAVNMDGSLDQRLQQDRSLRLAHHDGAAEMMQQAVLALGQQFMAALEQDRNLRLRADRAAAEQLRTLLGDTFEQLQQRMQDDQTAQRGVAEQAAQALEAMLAKQEQGNDIALDTQQVLMEFTASQKAFSASIQHSADTMSDAATNMNGAAREMSTTIVAFDEGVRNTLGTIEGKLGGTIESMDRSLTMNLGVMANLLRDTTNTLETSLDSFSTRTGETLGQVTGSMKIASESQQKVMGDVRNAMRDVQEMVLQATSSIFDISKKLDDSLRAVSKSNLQMAALVEPMKASQSSTTEAVASLQETGGALRSLEAALRRDGSEGERLRAALAGGAEMVAQAHGRSHDLLQRQVDSLEALRRELLSLAQPKVEDEAELAG